MDGSRDVQEEGGSCKEGKQKKEEEGREGATQSGWMATALFCVFHRALSLFSFP